MIDFTPWDKLQEFDMETTAMLWYASANNVEILDIPSLELNPYYHRLTAGIRNNQLKIEDAHLSLADKGSVMFTRSNLVNFLMTINEYIPLFLLPSEYRWLSKETSPFKTWLLERLMEGKLNNNYGIWYWIACCVKKLWGKFKVS
jgi:hypothetical protein